MPNGCTRRVTWVRCGQPLRSSAASFSYWARESRVPTGLAVCTWVHTAAVRMAALQATAPLVQDVVVAGEGRDYVGILVWPTPAGKALGNALAAELYRLHQPAGCAQAPGRPGRCPLRRRHRHGRALDRRAVKRGARDLISASRRLRCRRWLPPSGDPRRVLSGSAVYRIVGVVHRAGYPAAVRRDTRLGPGWPDRRSSGLPARGASAARPPSASDQRGRAARTSAAPGRPSGPPRHPRPPRGPAGQHGWRRCQRWSR